MIEHDGRIVHDVWFAHPVDRVWDAICDPAALSQWLMPTTDFAPRPGHRFHLDAGPPRGIIAAEVVAVDVPSRMQWRWLLDGSATTVTITLHADGDGTRLRLEHSDLPPELRPRFEPGWLEKFDALLRVLKGDA